MSALSSERMMKLMAYADGELEGADRAEVEKILATDIDAVRFVNEMAGLGELVQIGRKDAAVSKTVATFDIADAVMADVEREKSTKKTEKVVSLDAARERRKPNRNLKIGGAVAATLALAASVFLMTRQPKEQPMAVAPKATSVPVAQTQEPMPSHGEGIEVDAVESPGVSVFYLPGQNASTSVVVWVEESSPGEKK
jgi:anti-sigma factor RsiW